MRFDRPAYKCWLTSRDCVENSCILEDPSSTIEIRAAPSGYGYTNGEVKTVPSGFGNRTLQSNALGGVRGLRAPRLLWRLVALLTVDARVRRRPPTGCKRQDLLVG